MFLRRIVAAAGLLACFGLWLVTGAAAQIPSVRIDIPNRRPPPSTSVDLGDLVGGLFALKDGYDRSRQGFVCALAYEDANANGQRDRGEAGLPGWTFTLTNAAGATVARGVTDGKGRFCNERPLPPGAYSLSEAPGGGWVNTEPGAASPWTKRVNLPAARSVTALFGNCRGDRCERRRDDPPPATPRGPPPPPQGPPGGPPPPTPQTTAQVCVVKYQDYDGDGVRDTGEPGLPGWIFAVKTTSGTMLAFGVSNASGEWCSTATLPAGGVNVFETAQTGWTSTDPANVPNGTAPTKPAVLVAGQTTNVVFGNKTARVCVVKFNDLNANGVKNSGEALLAGWTFTLQGVSGAVLDSGVTDAQGQWCSTAILPVGYPVSVVETQQAGWWNTAPGGPHKLSPTPTVILALTAGQTANVRFGNYIPPSTGKVCVRKFRDLNSDGGDDNGSEPGLPGWTFTLTGPSGSVTLTTGANGSACTPANLAAGSYTITETLQSGWTNTNPGNATASKVINVNPTGTTNVVFGNVPVAPGILCATKYKETTGNRVYDAADPLLAGFTFEVRNGSGVVVATGVSNAQGRWCTTTPLPAGTYRVNEVQQPGWVNSDPNGPPNFSPPYFKTAIISATRGADLFFGNVRSGRVCLTKYNDINGNGQRDPGEPPLAGFSFHFQFTSSVHATDVILTTGPTGVVCLDLAPAPVTNGGGYWVNEIAQPGWVITEPYGIPAPHPSTGHVFAIVEGQTTSLMFGNHQASLSGRICVAKFNDLNGNGVRNAGEPLLPYWQFNVTGASGPLSGTTSYPGGTWCTLQVLTAETYTVTEVMKPGWIRTAPSGATPTITLPVVNGQTTNFTFGNRLPALPAKVCVTKYHDANKNGVRDAGETLLFGWTFTVRNAAGGLDDTGVTSLQPYFGQDPTGVWCSTLPLAAGPATVVETQTPGWSSSTPGGATPTKPITLVAGQTTLVEFGNYHTPPVPGRVCAVKFHDQDGDGVRDTGEAFLPGWAFTANGPGGSSQSGVTGGDGMICWELPPGTYSVIETLQSGWDSTVPGGPTPTLATTLASAQTRVLEFGNRQTPKPGGLCVTKYRDLDADGVRDPGEPLLSGWTFTLSNGLTGVTGAEGRVCWEVPEGTYTVTETMQTGWVSSDPGGANPAKTVTVVAGETAKPFFGNRSTLPPQPGKVCLVKYHDLAPNGVKDGADPVLLGWSFNLKTTAGASVGTITTGATPASNCRDLPPGTYRAEEATQTGWTNTDPGGSAPQKPFTIVSGQTTNLVFGNRLNPPAPQFSIQKFNDSGPTDCGPNGLNNPCVFRIRITNTGTAAYSGPASFSDSMRVLNLPPAANSMLLISVGQAGWSCSATGAPMTCTGPISLAIGQSVDVAVTFNFSHPVRPTRNCVTLTAPAVLPEVCITL